MGRENAMAAMPAALATLLVLSLACGATGQQYQQKPVVNDSQCDCYVTNGTNGNFFSNHKFYDFRSLTRFAVSAPPPLTNDSASMSTANFTSSYFTSSPFADDWAIMTWNNSADVGKDGTILMINSPSNLYIERNTEPGDGDQPDTYLTMRTARHEGGFQTAAEIETLVMKYRFLSVRMLARTTGASGACTAVFTYRGSRKLADVQEADIEVLTKDPANVIQYTNQPSFTTSGNSVDGSTVNATVPVDWTQWSVHRLDWTPSRSTWYVDGHEVASISFQVPRDASKVNLNSWSDGGVWTGLMDPGKQAVMQIQWLEMVFNTTNDSGGGGKSRRRRGDLGERDDDGAPASGDGGGDTNPFNSAKQSTSDDAKNCKAVCSIDESATRGAAVVVANGSSPASRLLGDDGRVGGLATWLPALLTALLFASSVPLLLG